MSDWPPVWADGTLARARSAFVGLKFGKREGSDWTVTLPASYGTNMNVIKKKQLTLAGARLAQMLRAIWP